MTLKLTADFASADEFLAVHDQQLKAGGLVVRGAALPAGAGLSDCLVEVRIGGTPRAEAPARVAGAAPGLGVMVTFPQVPEALLALAERLRAGDQDPAEDSAPGAAAKGPHKETLTLAEKMALAMTGDRETRFALLRDTNKQLHVMVLRNPRIGLEEVLWAARLTSLNPDALKLIAEHPEWGMNAQIACALVKNPKTPLPVAQKLVPRLPREELKLLAKSQGKPPLVQAAKKLLIR